jgi:flagellar basal-body rod modification protein FlgD
MTTVNPAGTTTQSGTSSTASTATNEGIGEEFNSFIQLLTAQIRNQDPLAPLDSTQFVEQLATFSALEQQVRSNQSLEAIALMMSDMTTLVAGQWLGQTVSFESSWIPFTGSDVQFSADLPEGTDRAVLTVKDSNGNAVWTETLDPEATSYTWDGRTSTGGTVPVDSVLQFSIDTYSGTTQTGSVAPRVITTVTAVSSENGVVRVGTDSKLSADLGSVQKVGAE